MGIIPLTKGILEKNKKGEKIPGEFPDKTGGIPKDRITRGKHRNRPRFKKELFGKR
jgi:hypothetical protein